MRACRPRRTRCAFCAHRPRPSRARVARAPPSRARLSPATTPRRRACVHREKSASSRRRAVEHGRHERCSGPQSDALARRRDRSGRASPRSSDARRRLERRRVRARRLASRRAPTTTRRTTGDAMSRARRHIVATDDVVDDDARRGRVERVISEVAARRAKDGDATGDDARRR